MPARYIAGYDGSDGARAALRFVSRLAETTRAEVIAASVYIEAPRIPGKGATDAAVALLDEQGEADAKRVLAEGEVPEPIRCAVGGRSPAEGLHRLAADQHADLLAVGATHHGPVGRLIPGSVGEHLLHGAPCPIAVVPPDAGDEPIRTVAVAYDESDTADAAVRMAHDLAQRLGARLVVVSVCEPIVTYAAAGVPVPSAELEQELEQRRRRDVDEVMSRLSGEVDVEPRVLVGPAGRTLVSACEGDVDVLVMGSRGYGPALGVLLGSVSRHVIDHAPCPVIVVPRAVAAEAAPRAEEAVA